MRRVRRVVHPEKHPSASRRGVRLTQELLRSPRLRGTLVLRGKRFAGDM